MAAARRMWVACCTRCHMQPGHMCALTCLVCALTHPNAPYRSCLPLCLLQLSADDKFSSYMDLTLQLANTQVRPLRSTRHPGSYTSTQRLGAPLEQPAR